MTDHVDPQCEVAHGHAPVDAVGYLSGQVSAVQRTLVAVFTSPVAEYLLRYASDVGYRPVLVVTDHHRPELGVILRDVLAAPSSWVGLMGSPRHEGPHVAALTELGVPAGEIARVHRPIGLNIGSKAPAEIAIATIAALIAERNHRPGGFDFK
jgi:xanthine dehydrogenase accessory factor